MISSADSPDLQEPRPADDSGDSYAGHKEHNGHSVAVAPLVPAVEERTALTTASAKERPARQENWFLLAALTLLAGISGIAYYLGFVKPYLLSEWYDKPLMDLAKINGHTAGAANSWALTWIVLLVCYYLAFRLAPSLGDVSRAFRWIAIGIVVAWALVFCVQLVFMYPVGAADIFDQMFRARITHHYGLNPFTTVPNSILGDTMIKYVAWRDEGSPYGPLWELLTAGTGAIAGDSLWGNLILFKVLVLIPYVASIAFTYAILRTIKPEWALRGTLFFAWNPLVIFEIAGNGHNDAFVVMFLLAAVYMLVKAYHIGLIPALMAGVLTKFVPVLLVPVAAAAIWRDRVGSPPDPPRGERRTGSPPSFLEPLRTLWLGSIIALGMAVVMYAPFWEGTKTIGALGRQSLFTASLPKVLADWLTERRFDELVAQGRTAQEATVLAQSSSESLVRNIALVLMAIVVLGFALRIFLSRSAHTPAERDRLVGYTLRSFYEIIFVYLAFATLWFQPWYLMWLIALTAPLASYTYAHRTLLFCIGGIVNYFVWDFIWLWNRAPNRDIQVTSALVVYSLPLAYTLYTWLRPLWKRVPARPVEEVAAPAAT